MKKEKYDFYQNLLSRYKDSCYGKDIDREQFVHDFETCLSSEPEFLQLFLHDEECRQAGAYAIRLTLDDVLVKPFVDALRAFGQGKPVDFSDIELQSLGKFYQTIPEFQELCANDPALSYAISFWLDELEERASQDEHFKLRELLGKLREFHGNKSVNFSDTELDLLNHFYRHNADFQEACAEEILVRSSVTYWLEVRQRRSSTEFCDN